MKFGHKDKKVLECTVHTSITDSERHLTNVKHPLILNVPNTLILHIHHPILMQRSFYNLKESAEIPHVMKSMKLASGSYDWFLMWRNSTTIFSFSLSSMTDTVRGDASLARKLP